MVILYNIVCEECGVMASSNWLNSGLECWQWAGRNGWGIGPGTLEFRCPECKLEPLEGNPEPPEDFDPPKMWCGNCKTGKCKKCKEASNGK